MIKHIVMALGLFVPAFLFSQAVVKGDVLINPYIGLFGTDITKFKSEKDMIEVVDHKRATSGGIRGQYISGELGDVVYGIGLDLGYSTESFSWTEELQESSGIFGETTFSYVDRIRKRNTTYGGMFVDTHFFRYFDKLDFSMSIMFGYGAVKYVDTPADSNQNLYRSESTFVYNWHAGVDYFVIEHLALSLRLGIGTQGILQTGLTFKL